MNATGVKIRYEDIAPNAKDNFIAAASEKESFVDLSQLQQDKLEFPNYGNPCELYSVLLDGNAEVIPDSLTGENVGLWSVQLSNDDGSFSTPITLTLTADGQYSSSGITLTFDDYNNIFANKINLKWYRNNVLLSDMDFNPDRASFFCNNAIENYDKLIISFYSLNMPKNRLKLRVVDYGHTVPFYGDELKGVQLTQQIDPISTKIQINTCDFIVNSKTDVVYNFQTKQPISVYFNGELLSTNFVTTSTRQSKRTWEVHTEDYIGLMDNITFSGGVYEKVSAGNLLANIFGIAKIPYNIDEGLSNIQLSGYIPYTSCKEALIQVVFAIQAVVDTSKSDIVRIYKLNNEVQQIIPKERILLGQEFTSSDIITAVRMTSHTYTPISETLEAYSAKQSGTGNNVFISFSEPLHDLTITNGTITERGTNYAIITAQTGCILQGKKYNHTTQIKEIKNPVIPANAVDNVISIDNATLISPSNIDNILQQCYNYLVKSRTIDTMIVESKHVIQENGQDTVTYDKVVNLGDLLTVQTEYLGELTGILIKTNFPLIGGAIAKECTLK